MRARGHRRGATLLVTVLLGLVAASITLVIVKTTLDNARTNAARRAYDVAYTAARSTAEETARRLSADPLAALAEVGPDEPSRICDAVNVDGDPLEVSAGQAWPAACGTAWRYTLGQGSTKVWLRLPTDSDQKLLIRTVVDVAGTRAGVQLSMEPGRTAPAALVSEQGLNLNQLRRGDGTLMLNGLVHAAGTITIPNDKVTYTNAILASETGYSGTLLDTARWYGPQSSTGTPPVTEIRKLTDSPLTRGQLRAKVVELRDASCRGGAMANTPAGSSELCFQTGMSLVDSAGQPVTAPGNVSTWLLLPARTAAGTIDVFYRVASGDEAFTCPEGQPNCSLPDLAASTSGHPALLSAWTQLGTFRLPAGSLIATDRTTHLGLCGEAGVGLSAACTVYGEGTQPGIKADKGFTLVVGSPTTPADLYLTGPIRQGNARFGAVVTGDVLVPYWAHPVAGALDVEIDLAVLGRSDAAPFRTVPESRPSNSENKGSALRLVGALAFARGPIDLSGFTDLITSPTKPRAPWWSSGPGWHNESIRRLKAAELADPSNFS